MSVRTSGLVLVVAFLLPTVVFGQAAADDSVKAPTTTNDDLMQAIDEIKQGLNKFVTRDEFQPMQDTVKDQGAQLQTLTDRLDNLVSEAVDRLAKQQQILDAIAHIDSQGAAIPNISGNMANSSEFRDEMSRAVNESIKGEGQFVVVNKMAAEQDVTVNGQQHRVMPGATLTLKVPVGTVTTRLAGQDIDNWTVTAPNYRQSVDIVPRSTSSVEVYRPAYVESEVYTTYRPTYSAYTPTYTYYSPVYWYYPAYYFAY